MRQIETIGRHYRQKYGQTVYKIPINLSGFTCPNIDGTVAKGGCSFCQNESFSPNLSSTDTAVKLSPNSDNPILKEQIAQLKAQYKSTKIRLNKKFKTQKYIIYLQSFTNTYAPLETIKTLCLEALRLDGVVGLSIGTRTDSISDEVLEFLVSINKTAEITLEYGVQSIYDETLQKINRGHDFANIQATIKKTKAMGLSVCAHLIFGLPGETKQMMQNSVRATIDMGIDSIKYHPLYVTKNTKLYLDYKAGRFTPISQKDYSDMIVYAISQHPANLITQRITAGVHDVVAPIWCADKHSSINSLRQVLSSHGMVY